MHVPRIGICTALEQARWGVWDQPAMLLPRNYIDAVQRAGGVALMLPPDPRVTADPDLALDLIDGLLLAGGADVDPSFYGEQRAPQTVHTVPERDDFELALARRAIERDIPFLGVCRGMQVMNVVYGGTLIQDLPSLLRALAITAACPGTSTAPIIRCTSPRARRRRRPPAPSTPARSRIITRASGGSARSSW